MVDIDKYWVKTKTKPQHIKKKVSYCLKYGEKMKT